MVPAPLLLVVFVLGILLGRSVRAMRSIAQLHAQVHSTATASAVAEAHNENQVVLVIDRDGVPKVNGAYVLGGERVDPQALPPADPAEWDDMFSEVSPAHRPGVTR
jgi:hypothetical protein